MNATKVVDVIKSPQAHLVFSFIVGLGLAVLLFHRPQRTKNISAVSPAELKDALTRVDGKCYRFKIEDASCPP